jgi:putative ATP-dependent endonuclease of the OLD family
LGLKATGLLVEGETEAAVFYGIGDRDAVGRLESQGPSIVSGGGKGGIPLAHAILTCLGIPTYVLFDGDSAFEVRAKAAGKGQTAIDGERTKFSTENRRLLKYLGEIEVDFPSEKVGDCVATLSDHLEVDTVKQDVRFTDNHLGRRIDSGFLLPGEGRCLM